MRDPIENLYMNSRRREFPHGSASSPQSPTVSRRRAALNPTSPTVYPTRLLNAMPSPSLRSGNPTPGSPASTETNPQAHSSRTKRAYGGSSTPPAARRRESGLSDPKAFLKVSRACDRCKSRKQKCNGTLPCKKCHERGIECLYNSEYRRGRPPTPPTAEPEEKSGEAGDRYGPSHFTLNRTIPRGSSHGPTPLQHREPSDPNGGPSRASPELETAEIEGQFFDPTSNLTFLHRAWKRFSGKGGGAVPGVLTGSERTQPLMSAGDKPFILSGGPMRLPDRRTVTTLFDFYFEQCVVTYRCLHRQYCSVWMNALISNDENNLPLHQDIGHAKAALVVNILAIASLRQEKISGNFALDDGQGTVLQDSDQLFCAASSLTNEETGLPRLESVQARILQVLYLLQTGRMNQAWYVFGSTVPIVSALGLHRRSHRSRSGASRSPTSDYIMSQCRKRTFWVVYTIDKYLAVVFGRPRLYHDDDIDQEYPDRVNDEDMSPQGPLSSEPTEDCHVDSLIFHAKIARIIDNTSREVYSLKRMPKADRLAAARSFGRKLYAWREALPPHLGTIRPLSLVPSFRRQAMALKLAYAHALMHANRPFLLGGADQSQSSEQLEESTSVCINAAKMALETVNSIVGDGSLFHAFWWMPYVTFCALAVVYVWEIQQKANGEAVNEDSSLFDLAERCQNHLAQATAADSPSRRYSIILEELRLEARQGSMRQPVNAFQPMPEGADSMQPGYVQQGDGTELSMDLGNVFPTSNQGEASFLGMQNPLNEWQATDWLDLDSSAFGPFPNIDGSPVYWMGDMGAPVQQ